MVCHYYIYCANDFYNNRFILLSMVYFTCHDQSPTHLSFYTPLLIILHDITTKITLYHHNPIPCMIFFLIFFWKIYIVLFWSPWPSPTTHRCDWRARVVFTTWCSRWGHPANFGWEWCPHRIRNGEWEDGGVVITHFANHQRVRYHHPITTRCGAHAAIYHTVAWGYVLTTLPVSHHNNTTCTTHPNPHTAHHRGTLDSAQWALNSCRSSINIQYRPRGPEQTWCDQSWELVHHILTHSHLLPSSPLNSNPITTPRPQCTYCNW